MKFYDLMMSECRRLETRGKDHHEREAGGSVAGMIEDAVVVDASNVARYVRAHGDIQDHLPSWVSPFDQMWVESSVVLPPVPSWFGQYGAFVTTIDFGPLADSYERLGENPPDEDTALGSFLRRHPYRDRFEWMREGLFIPEHEPRWTVQWAVYFDAWPKSAAILNYMLDEHGMPMWHAPNGGEFLAWVAHARTSKDEPDLTFEENERACGITRSILAPFIAAIGFSHCKNVEIIDGPPPPVPVRRKQERKLGAPLVTYKELVIDPAMTQKRYAQPRPYRDDEHHQKALHIARGHFAHYSEDKPLFGKYAGTFWRPAHVRGSADVGTVYKDYAVKPGKQEVA